MVAQPGRPLVHTDFLDLPEPARARRPAGRQRLRDPPGGAARAPRRRHRARPASLHARPEPPDRWVVELRRDGRRAQGRAPRCSTLPAGGTRDAARALSLARPPVGRAARPPRAAAGVPRPPRRADPLRPRDRRPPARATTRRSSPPSPAARRCRAPAARSPGARWRALRDHGISVQRIVLHTGVSSLERGERPYPERFKVPAHTARPHQRRASTGHRVIAVGTTVVRALETVAERRRQRPRRQRLDEPDGHPRARRPRRRRAAHRLARARGQPPADARGLRRPQAARALLRGGARPRLPLARVRRFASRASLDT